MARAVKKTHLFFYDRREICSKTSTETCNRKEYREIRQVLLDSVDIEADVGIHNNVLNTACRV